ncbi:MAG TPA: TetR/AcrR family transcriptional regulator [Spongiibacteraceae bacterium]|nr:TetR/AcrR family transcriptional regulator [Spongiibacteraceae bacterium]
MTEARTIKRRGRPAILQRDEIVAAALSYARDNGLANLSMRELASHMRTPPMSLYAHIKNKDDLLVAMLDVVLAKLKPPAIVRGDTKAALKLYLRALRKALNTLPGLCNSAVVNGSMTSPMLGIVSTLLKFLSALDQPLKLRVNHCRLLVWTVLGYCASEISARTQRDDPAYSSFFSTIETLNAEEHEHLIEALPLLATPQPEKVFELMVDFLVEGIWGDSTQSSHLKVSPPKK